METRFFNPDWKLITMAVKSHHTKEICDESQKIWNEIEKMKREWRVEELKLLPEGTMLRYTLYSGDKIAQGEMLKKIKDKRTYMLVERGNGEKWTVPYDNLEIPIREETPTSQDAPGSTISSKIIV